VIVLLHQCTSLPDGKHAVPVVASLRQPAGTKGVIYGVPLDLKEEEILEALHEQVKYVKRFKYKHQEDNVLRDLSTVLLHFS